MEISELLDRREIDELRSSYNIAGDRADGEGLAAVFAEDGILQTRRGAYSGRAEIAGMVMDASTTGNAAKSQGKFFRHHLTTSKVRFEDDTHATGRAYFAAITEIGLDHVGVYTDRYEKRAGQWFIVHRRVLIDWAAPDSRVSTTRAA